ncbi:DNA ligase [Cellvibrio sp. KY-GH-1]|uniref:RNA ligase family protein n=1 Tax=Cellvibrio sp. KY-GH-1 TaxID=2303332 RepID=UPI001246D489|nr:RNA ligase family protein [Cellvibrio sp. KY-GH-1]QEY18284.1 DNA ligase [Cellvibrio sp. KY-GH-1]
MNQFFRFPHTPHVAWLGKENPRDDKVLSPEENKELLSGRVIIEEKLDGANLGISLDSNGEIQVQNRGRYLAKPFSGQFSRLNAWLTQHQNALSKALDEQLIIFGEWCAAKHSLDYQNLPDWFIVFDIYDKANEKFWSICRRNELAQELNLSTPKCLFHGTTTIPQLLETLNSSSEYRDGNMEGIIIRKDSSQWNELRAKLVRPDFTQNIDSHWSKNHLIWNKLSSGY